MNHHTKTTVVCVISFLPQFFAHGPPLSTLEWDSPQLFSQLSEWGPLGNGE